MSIVKLTPQLAKEYVDFKNLSHKESKYINPTTLEKTKELIETYEKTDGKFAFVATSGKEIVGQIFMVKKGETLFIQLISVLEKVKGGGLAAELISKSRQVAKDLDSERIELIVDKDNLRAISFYKRVGFTYEKDHGKQRLVYSVRLRQKKAPIYTKWK